jgi:hypothetical protein
LFSKQEKAISIQTTINHNNGNDNNNTPSKKTIKIDAFDRNILRDPESNHNHSTISPSTTFQ